MAEIITFHHGTEIYHLREGGVGDPTPVASGEGPAPLGWRMVRSRDGTEFPEFERRVRSFWRLNGRDPKESELIYLSRSLLDEETGTV